MGPRLTRHLLVAVVVLASACPSARLASARKDAKALECASDEAFARGKVPESANTNGARDVLDRALALELETKLLRGHENCQWPGVTLAAIRASACLDDWNTVDSRLHELTQRAVDAQYALVSERRSEVGCQTSVWKKDFTFKVMEEMVVFYEALIDAVRLYVRRQGSGGPWVAETIANLKARAGAYRELEKEKYREASEQLCGQPEGLVVCANKCGVPRRSASDHAARPRTTSPDSTRRASRTATRAQPGGGPRSERMRGTRSPTAPSPDTPPSMCRLTERPSAPGTWNAGIMRCS